MPTVSALFVYPVKGCRGTALDSAEVESRGLRYDRRWMVVGAEGAFLTQRTDPALARIDALVEGDALVLRDDDDSKTLSLPLVPAKGAPTRRVRVWRDDVEAVACRPDADAWLTRKLGKTASLVFMPDDARRSVDPRYAAPGDIVGFADGFPLLLATTASLDDLNRRMPQPVSMDRFRPNVVVRGSEAWVEDGWIRILIRTTPLRVVKPCARCVVTTIDQRTGERGVDPLPTLATFRKRDSNVLFAQNCVPDGHGTIAVGDTVTIVEAVKTA